ncbi:MAG: uracil-DNA glycosylase, partial [Nocardia sp.]|nr:uracil-DNA glycosylase [Nocardia sp.]
MGTKPLVEIIDPGWAKALDPVADRIAEMGEFLRAENAAGRGYL